MKTYSAKASEINRKWHVVDAEGQTLGRLATEVSRLIIGKHKPIYTPNIDTGDFVVVINAEKVKTTGNKEANKNYYHHSGHPGGLKTVTLTNQLAKYPDRVIKSAVWGMIPKGRLGRAQIKKLKIYAGTEHPHEAQNPEVYQLDKRAQAKV
jgi:large subunit ribosomal protein L13